MKPGCWLALLLTPAVVLAVDTNRMYSSGDNAYTLKFGEFTRHYTVHVPPSYDSKHPLPIVIMLHGGGGTSQGAAEETG